jgi:hypothetical protein
MLDYLLNDYKVVIHPYIVGELACGNFKNRNLILSYLKSLPEVSIISDNEYHSFIDKNKLFGIGLGFVDIHILASAIISGIVLFTRDKALMLRAQLLGVDFKSE